MVTLVEKPRKLRRISEKAKVRNIIAGLPYYWDTLRDALMTTRHVCKVCGYHVDVPSKKELPYGDSGNILYDITDFNHVLYFSWYKTETGRYEVTQYISF